jgi:hypothetical protein
VQLDERPLVRCERAGLQPGALGQRQIADGAQQRRADQHVALAPVEADVLREQPGVHGQLARFTVEHRVVRGERFRQHPDGRPVRVAELVLEPTVMQRRAGMIAEGEEQLIADVFEPARPVRADDHAVEAVPQVDGDGDQRFDLRVGRRRLGCARPRRIVLPDDLVAGEDGASESLRHGAVLRIRFEPVRAHDVEVAVGIDVGPRDEHALLGLHQLDRRSEDEGVQVVLAVAEHAVRVLEPVDLPAQLAIPLALGAQGLLEAAEQLGLPSLRRLDPAHVVLQPLAVGPPLVVRLSGRRLGAGRPITSAAPTERGERREEQEQEGGHERRKPQRRTGHERHREARRDRGHAAAQQLRALPFPARSIHRHPVCQPRIYLGQARRAPSSVFVTRTAG